MNNLEELKNCLQGFASQSFRDFRIFICIDGSTDGTLEYLVEAIYNYNMEVLTHPNNAHMGRNKTRNLALNKISSKYVLFDSDIVPEDDLLKKHFDLLEEKDSISTGDILYENSKENVWALYLHTRGKNKYEDLSEMPAYYINTQNVAFKSTYFTQLDGQDPELSNNYGGDDTILGYMIGKQFNIPAVFNKTAVGFSVMDKSLAKALQQMQEFGAVNLKIIRRKYPEFKQLFRFDIIESNSLHYKLFRFFLKDSIAKFFINTINIFPSIIKIKIVHYLVFFSINKGYKTGEY
jgi:glycosyltransferase involved in cell wall biosynthesis